MIDLHKIGKELVEGIEWVGEEAATFARAVVTVLESATPSALKVATDVATDVAQGTVTPAQAAAQLQDVAALGQALQQAAQTIKAQQG